MNFFRIRISLLVLIILFAFSGRSQTVKLIDESTGFPVDHVLIYESGMNQSVLTNEKGEAPLGVFEKDATLIMQHPSYDSYSLIVSDATDGQIIPLKPNQIELNEVIISASKKYENLREVPRRVLSVTESEIQFYTPQTSPEILENTGQVFVQRSQLGGGSPMIRGFSANRVLLVFDGIRMNNAISRGGNLHNMISADPHSIKRMEVLFGPGTVNYGSDAIGGVVSMNTKELYLGESSDLIHGEISFGFASANQAKMAHIEIGGQKKKWAWHTSASVNDYFNLTMGRNTLSEDYKRNWYVTTGLTDRVEKNDDPYVQVPSGYRQYSIHQKFKFALSKKDELELFGLYSSTTDIPRFDRLTLVEIGPADGEELSAEWYYGPQEWVLTGARWINRDKKLFWDYTNVTASYQWWRESRNDRDFLSPIRRERTESLNIYGLEAEFSKAISKKDILQYGVSSYYNQINSNAHVRELASDKKFLTSTRYPNGGSELWLRGIFSSYKRMWNSKWTSTLGVRYTQQELNSKFIDDGTNDVAFDEITQNTGALTGSIGAVYNPIQRLSISTNLNTGFRAPNVDDMGKFFDPEPGYVMVPNPDLKPEYSYNAELGLSYSDSNFFRIDVSGFYSYLDDVIVRDSFFYEDNSALVLDGISYIIYDGKFNRTQALVNADFARVYGGHIGIVVSPWQYVRFRWDHTITRGVDNDKQPLRHVSPDFGAVHAIYQKKKWMLDAYVRYNLQFNADQLAPSEVNKPHIYASSPEGPYVPGWHTFNFMAQFKAKRYLTIRGGVENIADLGYRPYSSGISAPGINVVLGIKSSF